MAMRPLLSQVGLWVVGCGLAGILVSTLGCNLQTSSNTAEDSGLDSQFQKTPGVQQGTDPLLAQQWALFNSGQTAQARLGGRMGEDLNVFSATPLTLQNYALGYTGKGIELGILDTGLEITHPDLAANVRNNSGYNFGHGINGLSEFNPTNAEDTRGDHGTSVAGLAGASGDNAIGIMGVAPKVQLRGFNLIRYGDLVEEIAAYGVAPYKNLSAASLSVINKSYGSNPEIVGEDEGADQVMAAMRLVTQTSRQGKGGIIVKAGGNEYNFPANNRPITWCIEANMLGVTCYNVNQETENATPYQLLVGAFNADGKRASYSNTGSALWVVAPGGEMGVDYPALLTTDQTGCKKGFSQSTFPELRNAFNTGTQGQGNESCDYFSAFNGSSAAAPMVSGVVALLLEANPNLKWYEVKHILATTARKIDPNLAPSSLGVGNGVLNIEQGWQTNAAGYHFSNAYGFGAVDVLAALQMAKNWGAEQTLPAFKEGQRVEQAHNVSIANQSLTGAQVAIDYAEKMTVQTLEITLSIEAETPSTQRKLNTVDAADYWVEVTSPSGTKSVLMTPFNAYLSGYDLPNWRLVSHAFYGEPAQGTWQVRVLDVDGSSNNFIQHPGQGRLTQVQLRTYGY